MDYSLWSSAIFEKKYDQHENPLLGHRLKGVFMLITMVQFPASYLTHIPRYNVIFCTLYMTSVDRVLLAVDFLVR